MREQTRLRLMSAVQSSSVCKFILRLQTPRRATPAREETSYGINPQIRAAKFIATGGAVDRRLASRQPCYPLQQNTYSAHPRNTFVACRANLAKRDRNRHLVHHPRSSLLHPRRVARTGTLSAPVTMPLTGSREQNIRPVVDPIINKYRNRIWDH